MTSTAGKKTKSKPAKLTEFFQPNPSPPPEGDKSAYSPPATPQPSSATDTSEMEFQVLETLPPPPEPSMQQLFQTFRQQLQSDFKSMISELKTDIQSLISRTDHTEKKMSEFAKSHNTLIDSHSALEEEVSRLAAKVLDLEDRSRRNNIRIRGIPEAVSPQELRSFLTDLMALVLPTCTSLDLTIDRIHRIPKPKNIPPHLPRDTIARIHFFHIKDEFLKTLRKAPDLPDRFRQLAIYPDLSAATMLKRKEYAPLTKVLRDHNVQYRWGFPVKLIIYKDDVPFICMDPAAVREKLQQWNLYSTPTNSPPRKRAAKPQAVTPLWSEKQSRSRKIPGD